MELQGRRGRVLVGPSQGQGSCVEEEGKVCGMYVCVCMSLCVGRMEGAGCSIYLSACPVPPMPTHYIHSHPAALNAQIHTRTQPPLHYHQLDGATGRLQTYRLLPCSNNNPEWPLSSVEMGVAALPPGEEVLAVAYPDPLEVRSTCLSAHMH